MNELTALGPIDLRLPPEPSLSRVLRLAASGVASLMHVTVERVEDIKVAASEVLLALIEHGAGEPVDVRFVADSTSFTVRARTAVVMFDATHPDLLLCRRVLAEVCSQHSVDLVDGNIEIVAVIDHRSTS